MQDDLSTGTCVSVATWSDWGKPDILETQRFHELLMDYRGAMPWNAEKAFKAIQQFLRESLVSDD
jgi:hypothetical protein